METIKFKRLNAGATLPTTITAGSAGYDVYPCERVKLKIGRNVIPLGFAVELPKGMMMYVQPKSGMSAKGLQVDYNGITKRIDADVLLGLVDSDYRGEVGVIINVRDALSDSYLIPEVSIAQLTFHYVPEIELVETNELSNTKRGQQGFGRMDEIKK